MGLAAIFGGGRGCLSKSAILAPVFQAFQENVSPLNRAAWGTSDEEWKGDPPAAEREHLKVASRTGNGWVVEHYFGSRYPITTISKKVKLSGRDYTVQAKQQLIDNGLGGFGAGYSFSLFDGGGKRLFELSKVSCEGHIYTEVENQEYARVLKSAILFATGTKVAIEIKVSNPHGYGGTGFREVDELPPQAPPGASK